MAILAYWFRDWRKLEFALATLSSLYFLYWFVLPESPRWLLATGQNEKALSNYTQLIYSIFSYLIIYIFGTSVLNSLRSYRKSC